jgi:lipopolysaccharide biosynthesis protein
MPEARIVAFYLPQFHPIPDNNAWWGPGFTEWTNVAKAKPLFPGHLQPHLPADLGFYDLRVPEVREEQAHLARSCSVEAFCYWHYWFGHGRRILERPFEEVRDSGRPDFPFCLTWANQSWTGIWYGNPKSVLVKEYPGPEDEEAHFAWALPAFRDPRYMRVGRQAAFRRIRTARPAVDELLHQSLAPTGSTAGVSRRKRSSGNR